MLILNLGSLLLQKKRNIWEQPTVSAEIYKSVMNVELGMKILELYCTQFYDLRKIQHQDDMHIQCLINHQELHESYYFHK